MFVHVLGQLTDAIFPLLLALFWSTQTPVKNIWLLAAICSTTAVCKCLKTSLLTAARLHKDSNVARYERRERGELQRCL